MLYWVIRAIMACVASILFRIEVRGRGNVPRVGPLVVCSNHLAWWDPVVLAMAVPLKISFMAKRELFGYPVFGWLLARLGAFPVRRGTADRQAIRAAEAVLESGGVLGMFPEGTRSETGELGKAHSGAGYLAIRSGARVLPVGISGEYRVGGRLRVVIGEPMDLTGGAGRVSSKDMKEAGDRVMGAIAELTGRGSCVAD